MLYAAMTVKASNTVSATFQGMEPESPERIAFSLRPDLKDRLRIYMVKGGYNLREQSKAINDLIEAGLVVKEAETQKSKEN